jgi:steroid 5-alpha reductase family enzyme
MGSILSLLIFSSISILIYFTLVYILSTLLKRTDIVDIAWGLGFIFLTILLFLKQDIFNTTHILLLIFVGIWGTRLATHIFFRNKGKKEDYRYEEFKKKFGNNFWWRSYFEIFLLQGVLMILVSMPIIISFAYSNSTLSILNYIGIIVWIFGYLFETISDYQLSKFIEKKKKGLTKKRIMNEGLWKYTRHPNYFGEVTLWWGIWLISFTFPYSLLSLIGPLTITYLILKVSGIPLLEKKYEGDEEWDKYKKNTPLFFPIKFK